MVMAVKFDVDGEAFISYTVIGSARMRIHHEAGRRARNQRGAST